MIVMITPVLISRIHWATYILFTCLLAAFVPIVWFFYPESKFSMRRYSNGISNANSFTASNLSLEEVDNLFLPDEYQVRAASISYHPGTEKERRGSYGRRGSYTSGRKDSSEKV